MAGLTCVLFSFYRLGSRRVFQENECEYNLRL